MVKRYLPDTNILVYAFKGIDPYADWIARAIQKNTLVLSSLVVAEYLAGADKNEEEVLQLLTSKTDVLPITLNVAEIGAEYKKAYRRKTKKVWLSDCLIAATCKVYGTILVTSDKKDYPMDDITVIVNV